MQKGTRMQLNGGAFRFRFARFCAVLLDGGACLPARISIRTRRSNAGCCAMPVFSAAHRNQRNVAACLLPHGTASAAHCLLRGWPPPVGDTVAPFVTLRPVCDAVAHLCGAPLLAQPDDQGGPGKPRLSKRAPRFVVSSVKLALGGNEAGTRLPNTVERTLTCSEHEP